MSPEVIMVLLICGVAGFLSIIYARIEPLLKESNLHWYRLCSGFSLFVCSFLLLYLEADWSPRLEEVLVSVVHG